jgi:zinc protease
MPQRELGPYLIGLQTKNEQVDEAISVSRNELTKFLKDGPTNEELEQSKKNITGGFPLRTASNADIASYIAMIGFYEQPLDYLDTFSEKINKITRDEVMDAYNRRVHPEKMLTIIVGKQESTNEKGADKK